MWPEVLRAKTENRHELVLGGSEINERIKKDGLDLEIFNVTTLNFLAIHETNLGILPDQISNLVGLQSLVLHSNNLENFNENLIKLGKLKLLDLSSNELREIPENIDQYLNIVSLNLSNNRLENFPKLTQTNKLTVVDLSKNKLKRFPDICREQLANLSEVRLGENEIDEIPSEISSLPSLKILELGGNKIKTLPGELADCLKLKVLDLKNNPISDRRLFKLIDQCRIKQIIDYVKQHSPKAAPPKPVAKNEKTSNQSSESDEDNCKYTIRIHYAGDNVKVILDESVKAVREYFVACLVTGFVFNEETFKKFIQLQNKLHESVCNKRNASTIATHDFNKLPPGNLTYTTLPPDSLNIKPLNRSNSMSGAELFSRLQNEANNLRKERKRNTYSGIHKYLYLIEGRSRFPCLLNSEGVVISFPPITNSDVSKIELTTKIMLIEVTSSVSLHLCKAAMESLIKEMVGLFATELEVTQVKTTDAVGNLKVVYPSKTDLKLEGVKVVRD